MNKYEIKVTKTFYSTGDSGIEAFEHLCEFYDIDPYNDKIEITVIEGELK